MNGTRFDLDMEAADKTALIRRLSQLLIPAELERETGISEAGPQLPTPGAIFSPREIELQNFRDAIARGEGMSAPIPGANPEVGTPRDALIGALMPLVGRAGGVLGKTAGGGTGQQRSPQSRSWRERADRRRTLKGRLEAREKEMGRSPNAAISSRFQRSLAKRAADAPTRDARPKPSLEDLAVQEALGLLSKNQRSWGDNASDPYARTPESRSILAEALTKKLLELETPGIKTAGGGMSPQKAPASRGKPTGELSTRGSKSVSGEKIPGTALLIPWSRKRPDGSFERGYQWETPQGKQLSKSFGSEAEAVKNRPLARRHLDEAHQPLAVDVAAVKPRAEAPRLNLVRGSGRPEEVVLRFDKTDKPLSLTEVNALFPKARIQKLGNDAVFDLAGSQKYRLTFDTTAEAQKALKTFGPNVKHSDPKPSPRAQAQLPGKTRE